MENSFSLSLEIWFVNITRYVSRADPKVCARMVSGHTNTRFLVLACTLLCFPALLEAKLLKMLVHKSPRFPRVLSAQQEAQVWDVPSDERSSSKRIIADNPSLNYLFYTWISLNLQEVTHTHEIKPHRPDGSFVNGARQGTRKLKN